MEAGLIFEVSTSSNWLIKTKASKNRLLHLQTIPQPCDPFFEMSTKNIYLKKTSENRVGPPPILVAHSQLNSTATKIGGGPTRLFFLRRFFQVLKSSFWKGVALTNKLDSEGVAQLTMFVSWVIVETTRCDGCKAVDWWTWCSIKGTMPAPAYPWIGNTLHTWEKLVAWKKYSVRRRKFDEFILASVIDSPTVFCQ